MVIGSSKMLPKSPLHKPCDRNTFNINMNPLYLPYHYKVRKCSFIHKRVHICHECHISIQARIRFGSQRLYQNFVEWISYLCIFYHTHFRIRIGVNQFGNSCNNKLSAMLMYMSRCVLGSVKTTSTKNESIKVLFNR